MTFLAPGFLYAAFAVAAVIVGLHFIVTRQPRAGILPTAHRTGVRPPKHGDARRGSRVLGDEVLLLQSAPQPARSAHQDADRTSEFSVLQLGALDVFIRCGDRPFLPLSRGDRVARRHAGRGRDLAAVWRDSLPEGHRGRKGPRRADW